MEISRTESHSKDSVNFSDELETSILSSVTNQFVSQACNIPKRLYCPFCLFDFGFEFLLKSHIRETHTFEVEQFSRTKLHAFKTDTCSYCQAKFFIDGLLPKHVIRKHQECILSIVSTFDSIETICCNFCSYRTSLKQVKLLFIHLENKHLNTFSETLLAYRFASNGMIPISNYNPMKTASISDNDEMKHESNNSINEKSAQKESTKLKPILKKGSLYANSPNNHGLTDGHYQSSYVKKIHFNLPDSSISSIEGDKENFPLRHLGEKVLNLKIRKMSKKSLNLRTINILPKTRNVLGDITDSVFETNYSNNISEQQSSQNLQLVLPFKCGVCAEKFYNNFMLRHHVKKKHGKIHYHPRYKCGLCKAKFFRNNYLVRHNKLHHNYHK